MSDEELKALADRFRQKLALDPEIRSLSKKIADGTADFSDTSRLFWRRSVMLGDYLQGIVLDIAPEDRERLAETLLRMGYNDTNGALVPLQEALDAPLGVHLTPVVPKYPAERVATVAHALMDPTVPEETIVRRAGAPVANVHMSYHDKFMEENARIRAKLGMKPTITRYGSGCCKWCSEVAGRYRFGEQPDGIFRRHDNCDCVIIYDTQVLRGHRNEDGSTSRAWEEVDPAEVMRNGFKPVRNSRAQAESLQEKLSIDFMLTAESGKSGKRDTRTEENTVDLNYIHSEEYKRKFKAITDNPKVNSQLYSQAIAQLTHRNGTYGEDLTLINSVTGKIEGRQSESKTDAGVDYNASLKNAISSNSPYTLISIHNHPTNNPPTGSDLASNGSRKYQLGVVVTHNGRVFAYKSGKKPFLSKSFDNVVDKNRSKGYNEYDAIIETLKQYEKDYGIEWREL